MLKYIESTGRTEEAAIEAALQKLGMDRDDVSVEVLERAKTGFLGIGASPAKVKVTYEAPDEEPAAEEPAPAAVPAETPAKKRRRRRKKSGQSEAAEQAAAVQVQAPVEEVSEAPKKKSRRGVRRQHLEDTIPAAPSQPQTDFYKPNPLDGDVILDATARLLAPKPLTLSRPSRREEERKAPRKKKGAPQAEEQPKKEKKSREQAPAKSKKEKKAEKPAASKQEQPKADGRREDSRRRSRGRRNGPPEVMFRRDNQKDSTEQPSLMKPYYMTPDD